MENFTLKGGPISDPPKRLYHCIFSSYNSLFQDFFLLDPLEEHKIPKQLKTIIFDLTFCKTSLLHSYSEFMTSGEFYRSLIFPRPVIPVKLYMITYILYDQLHSFYSDKSSIFQAINDLVDQVHPSVELVSYSEFYRTRFQEGTVQPFKLKLRYFQPQFLTK